MNDVFLQNMWEEADIVRIIIAIISGMIVGAVYFGSLRWSIEHMSHTKHKIALYAMVALFRIALFFGVLAAVSGRNIVIVLIYVFVFFISRIVIFALDKKKFLQTEEQDKDTQ